MAEGMVSFEGTHVDDVHMEAECPDKMGAPASPEPTHIILYSLDGTWMVAQWYEGVVTLERRSYWRAAIATEASDYLRGKDRGRSGHRAIRAAACEYARSDFALLVAERLFDYGDVAYTTAAA